MTTLCGSLRVNMTRSVSLEWLLSLLNVCKTNTHWPNFRPASLYVGLTLSQRLGWSGWLPVRSHASYAADGSVLSIPITHVRECLPLSKVSPQTQDVHLRWTSRVCRGTTCYLKIIIEGYCSNIMMTIILENIYRMMYFVVIFTVVVFVECIKRQQC